MQACRARVDGDGMAGADVAREVLLELEGLRAHGEPARAQRIDDFFDVAIVDPRAVEGQQGAAHLSGRFASLLESSLPTHHERSIVGVPQRAWGAACR